MAYTATQLKESIERLYGDIDACIMELIRARLNKDAKGEGKALFKMEGLMVATEQELSCIGNYLEAQIEGVAQSYETGFAQGREVGEREMLNKACDWIINTYLGDYVTDEFGNGGIGDNVKLANDLRKAMED